MSILITIRTKIILCRLPSLRSYLKSGKTLKNMKKITLFIMDVGVLDQRFSLSEYWQGKSLVSRVHPLSRSVHGCINLIFIILSILFNLFICINLVYFFVILFNYFIYLNFLIQSATLQRVSHIINAKNAKKKCYHRNRL